jgi:uncharacterized membrane protein YedE/YeeE
VDLSAFTPWSSTLGGLLIGLASAGVLVAQGRVAGVSGICGQLLSPVRGDSAWRAGFLAGLVVVGAVGSWQFPTAFSLSGLPSLPLIMLAGLLVGFGTRLGNGCTSGHGVCGISRMSPRSLVATATFMAVAAATVVMLLHVLAEGA